MFEVKQFGQHETHCNEKHKGFSFRILKSSKSTAYLKILIYKIHLYLIKNSIILAIKPGTYKTFS